MRIVDREVDSSAVERLGYDIAEGVLKVEWYDGDMEYYYSGVTPDMIEKIIGSESIGRTVREMLVDNEAYDALTVEPGTDFREVLAQLDSG